MKINNICANLPTAFHCSEIYCGMGLVPKRRKVQIMNDLPLLLMHPLNILGIYSSHMCSVHYRTPMSAHAQLIAKHLNTNYDTNPVELFFTQCTHLLLLLL